MLWYVVARCGLTKFRILKKMLWMWVRGMLGIMLATKWPKLWREILSFFVETWREIVCRRVDAYCGIILKTKMCRIVKMERIELISNWTVKSHLSLIMNISENKLWHSEE